MSMFTIRRAGAVALLLTTGLAHASGVVPETSIVIVEQGEGEGTINVKNTDPYPVILLTTLKHIPEDKESLLIANPPAARVEPGKVQRVRFMFVSPSPLKSERLERVSFEGVPPKSKNGKHQMNVVIAQNLPVLIRPAGLTPDPAPWKRLVWQQQGERLTVRNPSPYVVRLSQVVQTRPDNQSWQLPATYVLPGQTVSLTHKQGAQPGKATKVRLFPATNWGHPVDAYEATLLHETTRGG